MIFLRVWIFVGLFFSWGVIASSDPIQIFDGAQKLPILEIWQENDGAYRFKNRGSTGPAIYAREVGFFAVGVDELTKSFEKMNELIRQTQKLLDEKTEKLKKLENDLARLEGATAPIRLELAEERDPIRAERLQALLKQDESQIAKIKAQIDDLSAEILKMRQTDYPTGVADVDALAQEFESRIEKSPRRVFPGDAEYAYFTQLSEKLQKNYKAGYQKGKDVAAGIYFQEATYNLEEAEGTHIREEYDGVSTETFRSLKKSRRVVKVHAIGLYPGHLLIRPADKFIVDEKKTRHEFQQGYYTAGNKYHPEWSKWSSPATKLTHTAGARAEFRIPTAFRVK